MNKKIIYSLVGLALVFFITSLFIFIKSNSTGNKKKIIKKQMAALQDSQGPETMTVKAFFFVESSRLMQPVPHELTLSGVKEESYLTFIQLLIKGQKNYITPVPDGVALRSLFLVENQNMLIIDFNEELVHNFPAGTSAELEFIYFFVNNICFNFKEIKKVKFLISGNEYRTISGHIDIENPFYPDYRYLKN